MSYRIRLLGPFVIEASATDPLDLKLNRKTKAILAYLAATGAAQSRRTLAEIFCSDTKDPAGTLRWHLSQIRRRIASDIVHSSRKEVVINLNQVTTDIHPFTAQLQAPDTLSVAALQTQIQTYRGHFLVDLELSDCPDYELWLMGERARLEQLFEKGALTLAGRYIQTNLYADARQLAQKLLNSNPLLEQIHRYLIWLYAREGAFEAARQQYEFCRRLFWDELAVPLGPETEALWEAVAARQALPPLSIPLPGEARLESELSSQPITLTPIVGRDTALAQLEKQWLMVQTGKTGITLIEGIAGGGKTHLVAHHSQTLPRDSLLQGAGFESTMALAYQPWLAILIPIATALTAIERQSIPENWRVQLARLLPGHFPDKAAAAEKQEFLFRAIVALIENRARRAPLTLFIDDLQWADATSLQLLAFVSMELARLKAPVMIIGAYRQEELIHRPVLSTTLNEIRKQAHASHLQLKPLTEADIGSLLTAKEKPQAGRLWRETGGNPLFLVEMLQDLRARSDGTDTLPIPPSLSALIEQRLSRLSADGRQVLETLAILDRPPTFDLLQMVSGRTEVETMAALESGLQWRFLQQPAGDQFQFSHDLFARAICEQLSSIRLQRLHHRAARSMIQLDMDAATIAYHWRMAGQTDEQIRYTLLAGAAARQKSAFADALALFKSLLDILPDQPSAQHFTALIEIAKCQQVIGTPEEWEQANQAALAVAQQLGRIDFEAEAAIQQIKRLNRQGATREAIEVAEALLPSVLQGRHHIQRARLMREMGTAHQILGEYEVASSYADQAMSIFREYEDLRNIALVQQLQGSIAQHIGHAREAIPLFKRALAHFRRTGDLLNIISVIRPLADALYGLDEAEEGRTYLEEALEISQLIGDEMGAASQYNGLGGVFLGRNDLSSAIEMYEKALAIATRHNHLQAMAVCNNNIASAQMSLGQYESSMARSRLAIASAREANLPRAAAFGLTTLGLCYYSQDLLTEALDVLHESFALRAELGEEVLLAFTATCLTLVYAKLNQPDSGRRYLDKAEELVAKNEANIPGFIVTRLHYSGYKLGLAAGNPEIAEMHILKAYDSVQKRINDPKSALHTDKSARSDIREIVEVAEKLLRQ